MLTRRGVTVVELLVAMTLAAVVLGSATSTLVRQRRRADDQASRARADSQLRAVLGELEAVLAGLAPAAGDLVAGEARDTAVQLRTVVASAMACDSGAGHVLLAADDTSGGRTSGFAATPKIGDSLWWRRTESADWLGRRVADISTGTGACAVSGPAAQPLVRLVLASFDTVPRGAPLRLTRQSRISFYRAADGTWQLGVTEWSDILHAFASPQPVAGPFTLVAPGGARTGFRYFDAAGNELTAAAQGVDVARIARVRILAIAPLRTPAGVVAAYRAESLDVALRDAP